MSGHLGIWAPRLPKTQYLVLRCTQGEKDKGYQDAARGSRECCCRHVQIHAVEDGKTLNSTAALP